MDDLPILECRDLTIKDHNDKVRGPFSLTLTQGKGALFIDPEVSFLQRLISLCQGFQEPHSGQIYWQGQSLPPKNNLQKNLLFQRQIGLVHRKGQLLSGQSLIGNLCLDYLYHQEIESGQAITQASLWLRRLNLLGEADTIVENLSENKRRLGLYALAFCKNPRLFIMERPFQFLDHYFPLVWTIIEEEAANNNLCFLVFDRSETPYKNYDFASIINFNSKNSNDPNR
jgi:ABC-type polar amino acid transport system ATPase subunit